MARTRPARSKSAQQIETELHDLFAEDLSDDKLLQRIEACATESSFNELIHLWGPELYRRNAVKFRPFLLPRLNAWMLAPWKGKHAEVLDAWFEQVAATNDLELFRLLYAWKIRLGQWSQPDTKQWSRDLRQAFEAAGSPGERARALARYDLPLPLDEATALVLFQADPAGARDFIQRHVFSFGLAKRKWWSKLLRAAEDGGDEQLYFTVYRRQVSAKQWEQDVLQLGADLQGDDLVQALEQRHPESLTVDRFSVFYRLLLRRGEAVLPYVLRHLQAGNWWRARTSAGQLLALARKKHWLELWSGLIRSCSNVNVFNKEVSEILANDQLSDQNAAHLLRLLAVPMREWNFGRRGVTLTHRLTDQNAVALGQRFPDLLAGPFRIHLILQLWGERSYVKLLALLQQTGDPTLIDYLASQAVVLPPWAYRSLPPFVKTFADHYENLARNPETFARRVVGVLGQLSASSVGRQYRQLVSKNALARLLFEGSLETLRQAPAQVRDLLESPNGHVQALALRLLASGAAELRDVTARSLDLLLPCLLRPLHSRTHRWAFQALLHAARPENAHLIVERARQAFDLQDPTYPREELLGVIAQLLQRFPELRRPAEQPRVYERTT